MNKINAVQLNIRGYKYKLDVLQLRNSATDSLKQYHWSRIFLRQYVMVLKYAER
jgi:hypothetical protein